MTQLDPKEILIKNKGLVICYVIALLPLPAWFLVVSDVKTNRKTGFMAEVGKLRKAKQQITGMDATIKNPNPTPDQRVFTQQDVDNFGQQVSVLDGEIVALRKVMTDRDAELEKWFDEFKDGDPELENYKEHWKEVAIPEMIKEFGDIVTNPNNLEKPFLWKDTPDGGVTRLKEFQKKFWVQKAMLTALKKGATTVTPKLLQDPTINVKGGKGAPPSAGKSPPLYKVIYGELRFTASLRDVNKVVKQMLVQKLPMRVIGLTIKKKEFKIYAPGADPGMDEALADGTTKGMFKRLVTTTELAKREDFNPNLEHYVPEPVVEIKIEVEVFDFDLPARPKAPAPAPAGQMPPG